MIPDCPDCSTPIAIIGMAGRFPMAESIEGFWGNLKDGVECITRLSSPKPHTVVTQKQSKLVRARGLLSGIDLFDAPFFEMSQREAELLDPQHRLFLECCWEALEQAGYVDDEREEIIALYAAGNVNTYLSAPFAGLASPVEQFLARIGNCVDCLPTRVSYKLDLRGESISVQTACSSSLVAVHMACQSLRTGNADLALAGGVSISTAAEIGYVYQEGLMFSPDGVCRAFDHRANGMVEGDGVGVVVLKLLSRAVEDGDFIHAVIKGSAINNDGYLKIGYTAPSVQGQAEVIATALASAGVSAETIGYVEAHGTGTPLGDPIEVKALTQAFRLHTQRKHFCLLGSVKPNIGHLIQAAGITGLIKAALTIQHGLVPPTLNFEKVNPEIDLVNSPFFVSHSLEPWSNSSRPRRAAVSSFGIGGTNAHVILEEAPELRSSLPVHGPFLVAISARSSTALGRAKAQLKTHYQAHPDLKLADIAYTLNTSRKSFPFRWAGIVDRQDELFAQLDGAESGLWSRQGNVDRRFAALLSSPRPLLGTMDRSTLLALADEWVKGAKVNWKLLYQGQRRQRLPLPTYPFERESYWVGPRFFQASEFRPSVSNLSRVPTGSCPSTSLSPPPREEGLHPENADRPVVIEAVLIALLNELGVDDIGPEDNLLEFGVDSIKMIDLLDKGERVLGIWLDLNDAFGVSTVSQMAELYRKNRAWAERSEAFSPMEEEILAYDIEVAGETATVTITKQDYLKYGMPEGGKNLRPHSRT